MSRVSRVSRVPRVSRVSRVSRVPRVPRVGSSSPRPRRRDEGRGAARDEEASSPRPLHHSLPSHRRRGAARGTAGRRVALLLSRAFATPSRKSAPSATRERRRSLPGRCSWSWYESAARRDGRRRTRSPGAACGRARKREGHVSTRERERERVSLAPRVMCGCDEAAPRKDGARRGGGPTLRVGRAKIRCD